MIPLFKLTRQIFYQVNLYYCFGENNTKLSIGLLSQFTKYTTTNTRTQNIPYDYQSVMHYEKNAFTANGSPSITPLQANVKIGQRYFLSSSDITAIRQFYNCSGIGTTLPPPTTTTAARKFAQQENITFPNFISFLC